MSLSTEDRFYPEGVKPYLHEPSKKKLKIVNTASTGLALLTLKDIKPGQLVFCFMGEILNHQTLFTLQISEGVYIEDPFVMGRVLHSCDPNMVVDMKTRQYTSTRDIKAGDFLTMDYETTEAILYRSFICDCGAINCKQEIKGYSHVD